jgi:large subunit ribosomal protein L14
MIQPYSRLKVADNSGAKIVSCIKVVAGGKPRAAKLGDTIIASVKSVIPQGNIKKGEVVKAVIIRQRKKFSRNDGSSITFDDNAVILINADGTLRATRIFGPVSRELRQHFPKIISLAQEVV